MNVVKALLSNIISFYVPISSEKGHCFLTPSTILQAKDNSFWFNFYLFDYQRTQTLDTICVASAIFFQIVHALYKILRIFLLINVFLHVQ